MLPDVDVSTKFGIMPEGRHRATLDEVESHFVSAGPYGDRRAQIWQAFLVWERLLRAQLPTATLWLNGGFVTHKTWAAPSDIDAFIVARRSEVEAAGPSGILPLLTTWDSNGRRVQPMSGLVDGHIGAQADGLVVQNYDQTWRKVLDENRHVVPGLLKGYVEVRP